MQTDKAWFSFWCKLLSPLDLTEIFHFHQFLAQNLELSNSLNYQSNNKILWIVCFMKDICILAFNRFNRLCGWLLWTVMQLTVHTFWFLQCFPLVAPSFLFFCSLNFHASLTPATLPLCYFVFPVVPHLLEQAASLHLTASGLYQLVHIDIFVS